MKDVGRKELLIGFYHLYDNSLERGFDTARAGEGATKEDVLNEKLAPFKKKKTRVGPVDCLRCASDSFYKSV